MKLFVFVLAFFYSFLVARSLIKRDKELFRVALFSWGMVMVVVYLVFFYCKGGELDWLLQPFLFIWPRR